jgi:hypothetical protein
MGTRSVTSFGEQVVVIADMTGRYPIDRVPRVSRQGREQGTRLVVVAFDDDGGGVDPDLETAIFDAP